MNNYHGLGNGRVTRHKSKKNEKNKNHQTEVKCSITICIHRYDKNEMQIENEQRSREWRLKKVITLFLLHINSNATNEYTIIWFHFFLFLSQLLEFAYEKMRKRMEMRMRSITAFRICSSFLPPPPLGSLQLFFLLFI